MKHTKRPEGGKIKVLSILDQVKIKPDSAPGQEEEGQLRDKFCHEVRDMFLLGLEWVCLSSGCDDSLWPM